MMRKYKVNLFTQTCPLFVPLVEEGWTSGKIVDDIIHTYLAPLKKKNIDTLILGCTHYPLLKHSIQKYLGKTIRLVDSADALAEKIKQELNGKETSYKKRYKVILIIVL